MPTSSKPTRGKCSTAVGWLADSTVLLIAMHCPHGHERTNGEEGNHLMSDVMEGAATDEDCSDSIDEIVHGIDVCREIGQLRHGARGREES